MESLYLIDASGYLYRSYFAIRNMTNDKGESTNALFGFIRSVQKLIKEFQPTHLAAIFDGPKASKPRTQIYEKYKAQRRAMPPDLGYQIDWAHDFCDLYGIAQLAIEEVEADDTIASIAKWAGEKGAEVFMCTSDKDMAQIVTDKIKILNVHKDNLILDPEKVKQTYGVRPDQIVDWLAMTGDTSDNIPGLPGFGPKTSASLLQEFETLDNILENPDQVPGQKKQETIKEQKELVLMSRRLVNLHLDVTFPKQESFFALQEPDIVELKKFYTYMNFSSLIKDLDELAGKVVEKDLIYSVVDDEKGLDDLISRLSTQKQIGIDTETTDSDPMRAELVGIGFCTEPKRAFYIPTNGKLGLNKVIEKLKPLLQNPEVGFFGHNMKYDKHVLENHGIKIANICFDTIVASYILNAHARQHSLDQLALSFFGKVKTPITDLIGKGKKQKTLKEVPIQDVANYCSEDVDYTFRLKQEFEKELKSRNMEKLYYDLELPLLCVLAKMEQHGMYLEKDKLKAFSEKINQEIERLKQDIFEMAGESFNLNSPKQLGQILFDKLGIRPQKKTATGLSTNAAVLEMLGADYPIAKKILEYRSLEKLRAGYAEALPKQINPKSGRIHPTFLQSATATGRIACQDPNLQNIPVRSELGKKIREAFCPQKTNWSYLSADYSQIELRLLAHFSEDPTLIEAFGEGKDIHAHTASIVYGVPIDQVTSEMRFYAKAVNFGMIYGQKAFGLSQQLGIPVKEAAAFIETYFERYKNVQKYLESCKQKARQTGKTVTMTGRERLIPEINSRNSLIRQAAERLAVNTPLQGSNADLIKMAMLKIDKKLEKENKIGYMILQIHDELLFEIPNDEIESIKKLVKETMEGIVSLKVPLIVDLKLGNNWKEC